jgi:hypothetical protein
VAVGFRGWGRGLLVAAGAWVDSAAPAEPSAGIAARTEADRPFARAVDAGLAVGGGAAVADGVGMAGGVGVDVGASVGIGVGVSVADGDGVAVGSGV